MHQWKNSPIIFVKNIYNPKLVSNRYYTYTLVCSFIYQFMQKVVLKNIWLEQYVYNLKMLMFVQILRNSLGQGLFSTLLIYMLITINLSEAVLSICVYISVFI